MMDAPDRADTRPTHLTTFTIKAAGQVLDASMGIISIEIHREVNRVPKALVVLQDGDAATQSFAASEGETLIPGVEIEILGGYSSGETTLFKGIITRHRVELSSRTGSHLLVEARDPAFRMTLGRRSRNFTDVTDADVMEQLIGMHEGLSAEVTATTLTHPQLVQHQVSDWDFLVMRAELAELCVLCLDGTVKVAPPAVAGRAASAAIFGAGMFAAELEINAESQFTAVQAAAWDTAKQELVTVECDDVPTPGPGDLAGTDLARVGKSTATLRHSGPRDQAALDGWAASRMGRARRAAVRGKVCVQGTEALIPGTLIELGGLGRRFNGLGFVSGVRHRLGRGDWKSEAFIGLDPRAHAERFDVAAPGAGGMLPPVQGLQIGVVVALEGDPSGEERIQLRLPTITETDGLLWARQARPDAGQKRGAAFRPEIGDEVVVGFLDADPRDPVILGALHSSNKPSPIPAADLNHEKGIITRSGMRLHWNDDTVVTTIDTPGGNRILLSEEDEGIVIEDQNGNKVEMNADGLLLESPKDVKLVARGAVKIEGNNLELVAKASFKAEGSGGAEIKSDAITVIKGAMVKIN